MQNIKILSWNVNGVRAAQRKGFLEWLQSKQPDIVCLQETKAEKEQLDEELLLPDGYTTYWNSSKGKKGYSGTAIFTKWKPDRISYGLGVEEFDQEGRTLIAEFGDIVLFNIYFPNGKGSPERLEFKMGFYEAFQKRAMEEVKKGKKVIMCGDVNTAHHPIDLARPKDNIKISGFLPMERDWMDRFEGAGFHDTFRIFHPEEPDHYSWWSMRAGSRGRNVGWRIDYFYCSDNIKDKVRDGFILPDVMGSDHCPVGINIEVPKALLANQNVIDEHELSGDGHVQPVLL